MRSDLTRRLRIRGTEGVSRHGDGDLFGMASEDEASNLLASTRHGGLAERAAAALPLVQGGYYLLTGLWPLAHMRSFEWATGRKTDRWLVRTVGALAAALGSGLLQAGRRGRVPTELRTVSLLAAAGFVAVEVPTALRGRISPVYLADALLELGFIGANAWVGREGQKSGQELDALVRQEAERL
jgi:hypothetical protein